MFLAGRGGGTLGTLEWRGPHPSHRGCRVVLRQRDLGTRERFHVSVELMRAFHSIDIPQGDGGLVRTAIFS